MLDNTQDQSLADLKQIFDRHEKWLVITGAGISLASGIPTYRDHDGEWRRSEPIKHQEFIKSESKRRRYWARSYFGWPPVENAEPNAVHYALVELEKQNKLAGLITQNVDRLHQKAGHQKVIDLHGRLDRVRCLNCGAYESRTSVQQRLLVENSFLKSSGQRDSIMLAPDGDAHVEDEITERLSLAPCLECGGTLMPDVVFFGGTVPEQTRDTSLGYFENCDAVLVLGSSLMVFSAFRYCKLAKAGNKPLAIVSRGKTRADNMARLKINDDCETALQVLL